MGKCNTLSAILRTCNLGNCLCCNITCCRKTLWLLDHNVTDHCSVLKHIFQIHQTAVMHVLCKIIRIMEMNHSTLMCLNDFWRKKETSCDILTYLACHVISLYAVHCWILIGILLNHFFVIAL